MNDISLPSLQAASTEVEVVEARETWSEYRLADGTVLRIKPIMISVSRIGEPQSPGEEPVYSMKSTLVTDVRAVRAPLAAD